MERIIADQIKDYVPHFLRIRLSPLVLALTVQLIAAEHVTPLGAKDVRLTKNELKTLVLSAKQQLNELERRSAQA